MSKHPFNKNGIKRNILRNPLSTKPHFMKLRQVTEFQWAPKIFAALNVLPHLFSKNTISGQKRLSSSLPVGIFPFTHHFFFFSSLASSPYMYVYIFLCFERIFLLQPVSKMIRCLLRKKDVDECGKRSYGWSDKSAVNYSYAV